MSRPPAARRDYGALCALERGHPVVTSDADDIRAIEPSLTLLSPA